MKKQKFLTFMFLAFTLQACALTETKTTAYESKPEWINNPKDFCTTNEMCATGSGLTRNRAKANARSELAKIFESKIKTTFETTFIERNDTSSIDVRDYVSDESDVILQSVEIKETFETRDEVFALAVLNKSIASRITKQDIDTLDKKMELLLNEDSPAAAVQLEKMYEERGKYNRRYTVLTGLSMPEKISYDQIYNNKKARIGKRHIFLIFENNALPSLKQAVRKVLTQNGYTFANEASQDTPSVVISFKEEKQHLNIDGFVKYSYHFTLKGPDKNGQTVDVLATTIEMTGRNRKQTYANALNALQTYITENILNLNF